jgi:hypothetical protein
MAIERRVKQESASMEHLDKLAEEAVKEAIKSFAAAGKRAFSGSVPPEAERLLLSKARGRLSQPQAAARVTQAVERLHSRRTIKAPQARQNDWVLMGAEKPPSNEK